MNFRYSILAFGLLLSSGIRCSEDADFLEQIKPIPFSVISQSHFSEDEFDSDFIGMEKNDTDSDETTISENIDQNVSSEINDIIFMLNNLEKFSTLPGKLPNSLILHGPSGTGKTTLAQIIAHKTGRKFIKVSAPQMVQKFQGATQHAIKDLFVSAKASKRPCVLFLDELDGLVNDKAVDSNGTFNQAAQAIQTELDDCNSHVFFITATNFPDRIPHALENRMGKRIEVQLPDETKRKSILVRLLADLPEIDIEEFTEITDGFNCRELESFAINAHIRAIQKNQATSSADLYDSFFMYGYKPLSSYLCQQAMVHFLRNESINFDKAHFNQLSSILENLTGKDIKLIIDGALEIKHVEKTTELHEYHIYVAASDYLKRAKNSEINIMNRILTKKILEYYARLFNARITEDLFNVLLGEDFKWSVSGIKRLYQEARAIQKLLNLPSITDKELIFAFYKNNSMPSIHDIEIMYKHLFGSRNIIISAEFLTNLSQASANFTAQNIYAIAAQAESEKLENGRALVTEEDLLNALYSELLKHNFQLPIYEYQNTSAGQFALQIRIAPIKKYLKARNVQCSDAVITNIAQEMAHLPVSSFETLAQIILKKSRNTNQKTVGYAHFEEATSELKMPTSKRYIINPNDIREIIKTEIDNCFLLDVFSQKMKFGGGRASCGYHALKNAMIVYDTIQDLPQDRLNKLRQLQDTNIMQSYFGSKESPWRKVVLQERWKKLLEDFIYDALLMSIVGESTQSIKNLNGIVPEGAYSLRLENNNVIFKDISTNGLTNNQRQELLNALPIAARSIAQEVTVDRFPFTNFEIANAQIVNHLKNALLQLNPNSQNTNDQLLRYIPKLQQISIRRATANIECIAASRSLSLSTIVERLIAGPEGLSSTVGDWLTQEEINLVKNLESQNSHSTFQASKNANLLFVNDLQEFLQNPESKPNHPLIALREQLSQPEGNLTQIVMIFNEGHWLSCVVNKQGKTIQFIFTDSLDNSWNLESELNLKFIRYMQNKDLVRPAQAASSDNEQTRNIVPKIGINSPRSHIRSRDLPTLASIFNNKVPNSINTILRALTDLNAWSSRYRQLAQIKPLMLYGPPGTGKTTAAEIIARRLNRELIYVSGGDFGNEYKNSEQAYLKKFFEEEIQKSGEKVIVFIDEVDALARMGNAQSHESTNQRYTTFMRYLDLIQNNENIFIITATNNPEVIAPAVTSRFEMVKVDLPDYTARENLILNFQYKGFNCINKTTPAICAGIANSIAILTKGFSTRDIETFIQKAIINFNEDFPIEQPYKIMDTLKSTTFQFQKPSYLLYTFMSPLIYLANKTLLNKYEQHLYSAFCKQREQVELHGPGSKNANLTQASVVGAGMGGLTGFYFGGPVGAGYGASIGGTVLYGGMKLYLDGTL